MGMTKHKHTCLIMAMMSCNNTSNNVLTNAPKEVLEHIAGFIAGHRSRPACNVFGLRTKESALFRSHWCSVPKPLTMLIRDLGANDSDGELEANVVPAYRYYFECIEEHREECWLQAHHLRVMTRWERIILHVCGLNGVNWN